MAPKTPVISPAKLPALLVLVAGLCLAVLIAVETKRGQQEALERELRKLAQDRAELIRGQVLRSMEVLHALAGLYRTDAEVTREEFRTFVEPTLSRQPELQALAWDPRVKAADREKWEAKARAEGFADFSFTEENAEGHFIPAAAREEYFPVFYLESLARNAPALGFDVGSEPVRRAALELARDSGLPTATAPVRLAQEPGSQSGFVVFLPIYRGPVETAEQRRENLLGFATAVFRIGDLIESTLRPVGNNGVLISIEDPAAGGTIYRQSGERWHGTLSWTTPVEFAGRHWNLHFEPDPLLRRLYAATLPWIVGATGAAITGLLAAYLWLEALRSAQLKASHEALLGEILVRKEAEASAESANKAKSEFLASMSHEIRTPMNSILGYSQILARDSGLPPFHRDMIATILSSGNHLLHLIDEILDLSKIDAGRMEITHVDFDVNALANELVAIFQHPCEEKQLGLRLDAPALGWPLLVHGDEGKLRQILINLLGNAVKFTKSGRVVLRIYQIGDAWDFEVEDTGPGIDPGSQERIFEPFQQDPGSHAETGTGLGLAISKRQAAILGGALTLDSQPGHGSTFRLSLKLPLVGESARKPAPQRQTRHLAEGNRVKALVVDDIAENRDVLATMLTQVGCEVVLAEHGRQAVEVTGVSRPQIVFMDVRMPEFDGIEATRRIVNQFGTTGIKVIATSASALVHQREQCLKAGCDDFVAKPFHAERIYAVLHQHLGVNFDSDPVPQSVSSAESIDFSALVLPEELASRMVMAAELHSATVLKNCLAEVEALGPPGERLAQHLREFVSSYDMKTIQRVLAQIQVT
ncbi:CHASE domain-containing protein [Luteolibacter arcticus]|uniref:histidine kinase n=1 Tax=Luteolibacter arcticus TaxID=1581411 RepID=A0ABT3GCM8_9BACT|nr:CHASE domain-containing protein [Luteolibacter arcticus]MCW1921374.1 CHASE domain-containing protein [Luteolibacter arcticus]